MTKIRIKTLLSLAANLRKHDPKLSRQLKVLADDFPWNLAAIAQAKTQKTLGLPIKVVSPEYLILYKLEVAREQDITDIKNLLRLKGVYKAARRLVKKYNAEQTRYFEQLYQESQLGV